MSPPVVVPPTRAARASVVVSLLAAAVIAIFFVRLAGVVEPIGPDQGVYLTIVWGLRRGLRLYRDLWEQKPPGIYLIYRLGLSVFGERMATAFWLDYAASALTTLVLFDLGRRLVSLKFGALVAAIYAFASLPPVRYPLGGFLERSVTEPFIVVFAAAAAWSAAMAISRDGKRWPCAAGLLIGMAAVFKQTALIYWPAFTIWTWLSTDVRRARRFAIYSGIGAAIAPILAVVWLWSQGVLQDAYVATIEYNMAYLAVGGQTTAGTLDKFAHEVWRRMKTDEVWALGTLSATIAVYAWWRRRTTAPRVASLGALWLAATLIATAANGPRTFSQYFIPSLLPLSLCSAWLVREALAWNGARRIAAFAGIAALTMLMLTRSGSLGRGISMTTWDAQHLFGRTDREAYLQRFQSKSSRAFSAMYNERLAAYIRTRTAPDERIFVFGMSAGTYFLSGRLPATKFLWAYPAVSNMIDRPDFRVETLANELARIAPRYIVLQQHNGDSFSGWRAQDAFNAPALQAVLASYSRETEIGDFLLYRRTDAPADAASRTGGL
jgi:4-amino-4-deoxy-L-arabinose transferase-like glycosyltransferase